MKKKSQSALFSPPGQWTGNNFLFKGGLRPHLIVVFLVNRPGELLTSYGTLLCSLICSFLSQDFLSVLEIKGPSI